MEPSTWYIGGGPLLRMTAVVACAFVTLFVLRRSTGGRGLWNLTAVDLAATIAIGVTLAVVLMSPQVPAVEAVFGMALLVGLHAFLGVADDRGGEGGPSPRGHGRALAGRESDPGGSRPTESGRAVAGPVATSEPVGRSLAAVELLVCEADGSLRVAPRRPRRSDGWHHVSRDRPRS